MRGNSNIISSKLIKNSDTDAFGINDTFDQYNSNVNNKWPTTAYPTEGTITPSTTLVNENRAVVTFTASVNNWFTGTMYYVVTGGPTDADFVENASGSFSVTDGSGSFSLEMVPDGISENDNFQVELRRDSTSGLLFDTTSAISLTDAPLPLGEDLRGAFWSISEYQNNDGAGNTTANYSVSEIQQDYAGTGRLYLIHKVTGATTFYNDVPIACIQILNAAGTTVNEQYWFGTSTSGNSWTTYTAQVSIGGAAAGITITPSDAAANYTYTTNVVSGASVNRFTLATSTGSSSTGCADGIAQPTGPMTLGEKTMAQSSGTYYMYRETSGSTRYYSSICRSPSRTWTAGERIRIAYNIGNISTANYYDEDDTLFVGIN